jgi:glycosyltransferase involved in cell wall biosynthesis
MLSESQPKVSVIVPNYNHARFLHQRLDSVFSQTFLDKEVIILDDASTDNSREVIQKYTANPRVLASFNTKNSGSPFAQWNKGVQLACGKYIWIAESDDWADSRLLEVLVGRLESNSSAVLAYCQSNLIDENGQVKFVIEVNRVGLNSMRWRNDFVNEGIQECRQYMINSNIIANASAVVFRRDAYKKIGGADVSYQIGGDWLTWARMIMLGQVIFVAQPLNFYRLHDKTARRCNRLAVSLTETYRVLGVLRSLCDPSQEVLSLAYTLRANRWAESWLAGGMRSLNENWMVYNASRHADRWAPVRVIECILKWLYHKTVHITLSLLSQFKRT